MAKFKKKLSRFGKLARVFNISSTRGKMFVFLLSFAILGGGYMAYQAFAATRTAMVTVWPKNNNNNRVFCLNMAIKTNFGPIAYNCIEWKSSPGNDLAYGRVGNYSPVENTFSPTSGDFSFFGHGGVPSSGSSNCANIGNNTRFVGLGTHISGYSQLRYGYIYIWQGTNQRVKPATYSPVTAGCFPTGDWKPAIHW